MAEKQGIINLSSYRSKSYVFVVPSDSIFAFITIHVSFDD